MDHVGTDNIRERLNVENVAERCRKARLRWFGSEDRHWKKKKRKTEAEMYGLRQPRYESYRDNRR